MIANVLRRLLRRKHSGSAAVRRPVVRLAFDTLEDRLTPTTLMVGAGEPYTTISSAVTVAKPNDTILVQPGTYTEQVIIGSGLNGLTLTTASGKPDATIQMPSSNFGFPAVVEVSYSKHVTINDFNIAGNSSDPTTNITQYGIRVDNGASANITCNNIANILGSNGAGIDLGDSHSTSGPQSGSGIVVGNTVSKYTAVGIVVDSSGSVAAVAYNNVTGQGSAGTVEQFGIQISNGANADVCANSVSANSDVFQGAVGILISYAGNGTKIEDNFTTANEYGIFVYGSATTSMNIQIDNNISYKNNNDGIQLQGTTNGSVTENVSAYNGGDGISVYGPAQNTNIADNVIYGNAGNGVTVQDTTGTKVVDNLIVDNGGSGISLIDASGGSVKFNLIDQDADQGNANCAISVTASNTVKIHSNTIVN